MRPVTRHLNHPRNANRCRLCFILIPHSEREHSRAVRAKPFPDTEPPAHRQNTLDADLWRQRQAALRAHDVPVQPEHHAGAKDEASEAGTALSSTDPDLADLLR